MQQIKITKSILHFNEGKTKISLPKEGAVLTVAQTLKSGWITEENGPKKIPWYIPTTHARVYHEAEKWLS